MTPLARIIVALSAATPTRRARLLRSLRVQDERLWAAVVRAGVGR